MRDYMDQYAIDWNNQIGEQCASEIQALTQATRDLLAERGMQHMLKLIAQLDDQEACEDRTEETFRQACHAYTQAIRERAMPEGLAPDGPFVSSRFLSVLDGIVKQVERERKHA